MYLPHVEVRVGTHNVEQTFTTLVMTFEMLVKSANRHVRFEDYRENECIWKRTRILGLEVACPVVEYEIHSDLGSNTQ